MRKKYFTLVETLMSAAILAVLGGILSAAFIQMHSLFETNSVLAVLQAEGRRVVRKISYDLRQAGNISIVKDSPFPGTDSISYYLLSVPGFDNVTDSPVWNPDKVTVCLNGSSGALLRSQGNSTLYLSGEVKSINFSNHALDSSLYLNELRLALSLEKKSSAGKLYRMNMTSVINIRN